MKFKLIKNSKSKQSSLIKTKKELDVKMYVQNNKEKDQIQDPCHQ